MQELEWKELIDGESEINAEDINKLANYVKQLNKNKPDKTDISIDVDGDLSLKSENPVQNKVITVELNKKASMANAFDSSIKLSYVADNVEEMLNSEKYNLVTSTGIKKVEYSLDGFSIQRGILIAGIKNEEYDELYALFYANDGTVWKTSTAEDWGMILDWEKVSVSQTDLDDAIGDVETALENIIAKYGLGGDAQ